MSVEINITENKYYPELTQEVTEIIAEIQTGYYPVGGGGDIDWDNIDNKPTEFPPEIHINDDGTIRLSETTQFGRPGESLKQFQQNINTWADGVNDNISGFQNDLNEKVDITELANYFTKTESDNRYKSISYVPTWNEITGKPTNFNPTSHNSTHENGGTDQINGQNLFVEVIPSVVNYTPYFNTLKGHLNGIDSKLGELSTTTAGLLNRVFFTADVINVNGTNFYASNPLGQGTATSATQTVSVNDNETKYFPQSILSTPFTETTYGPRGVYSGQLSVMVNVNSAEQEFGIEIYKANINGVPIDSGIAAVAVGSLGVRPLSYMDSGALTLDAAQLTNLSVTGVLSQDVVLNVNERLRYVLYAKKIGTAGNAINMSVYLGSLYNSYYDAPVENNTNNILNKSQLTGLTLNDALNGVKSYHDGLHDGSVNPLLSRSAYAIVSQLDPNGWPKQMGWVSDDDKRIHVADIETGQSHATLDDRDLQTFGVPNALIQFANRLYNSTFPINTGVFVDMQVSIVYSPMPRQVTLKFTIDQDYNVLTARGYKLKINNTTSSARVDLDFATATLEGTKVLVLVFNDNALSEHTSNIQEIEIYKDGEDTSGVPSVNWVNEYKQDKTKLITITSNTVISDIHNGAILHVINSVNLLYSPTIKKDFNFVVKAFGNIVVQHIANSGITLNSSSGYYQKNGAMVSVYCHSDNNVVLNGELSTS